jgi:hypothetical protein
MAAVPVAIAHITQRYVHSIACTELSACGVVMQRLIPDVDQCHARVYSEFLLTKIQTKRSHGSNPRIKAEFIESTSSKRQTWQTISHKTKGLGPRRFRQSLETWADQFFEFEQFEFEQFEFKQFEFEHAKFDRDD